MKSLKDVLSKLKSINESAATAGDTTIRFKLANAEANGPLAIKKLNELDPDMQVSQEGDIFTCVCNDPDKAKKELDTIGNVEYLAGIEEEDGDSSVEELKDEIAPSLDALNQLMQSEETDEDQLVDALQNLMDKTEECMSRRK